MFNYKAKVSQDQFFKYGYAEAKMLMCCDIIGVIKKKHKSLKMQRSLSAKRVMFTRDKAEDSGRVSVLAHDQGKQSHFYYERDSQNKTARVNSLNRNLQA